MLKCGQIPVSTMDAYIDVIDERNQLLQHVNKQATTTEGIFMKGKIDELKTEMAELNQTVAVQKRRNQEQLMISAKDARALQSNAKTIEQQSTNVKQLKAENEDLQRQLAEAKAMLGKKEGYKHMTEKIN